MEGFNIWFPLTGFLVGSVLGSLAKAIADRSLSGRTFFGRSYCPNCKKNLRWYDLLPIVSYLTLRGRCRYCHKKISKEYLIVELILGVLIGFLFWHSVANIQNLEFDFQFQSLKFIFDLIFKTFFITVLIIITITDLRKTLIPDRVMIPAIITAFAALVIFTIYRIGYLYFYLSQTEFGKLLLPPNSDYFQRHTLLSAEPLILSVISGLAISLFFLALIFITKGRGMGGGDVKLGMFMGLGLGFPGIVFAALIAFTSGALVAIVLIILGKKKFGENIPFGPFLVLGSIAALFWGEQIKNWYLIFPT